MYPLKGLIYQKIFSISNQNGDFIFNGKKLPQELYEDYTKSLWRKLIEFKKESMELNEFPQSKETKLNLVEEAHKYRVCQDLFKGKCHLCNERCIGCFHNVYQCIECYTVTLKRKLDTLERKDNPNFFDKADIVNFHAQLDSHEKKICTCGHQQHVKRSLV
jgi:hypothetical protein